MNLLFFHDIGCWKKLQNGRTVVQFQVLEELQNCCWVQVFGKKNQIQGTASSRYFKKPPGFMKELPAQA
jgi:hypothetical protein